MENNIDKLFKSKLGGDSAPYDPAAWGRMASLIDEDEEVNGNGIPTAKSRWKSYLGLALLLIISLIGFWQFNGKSDSSIAMKTSSANDKESWSALNSDNENIDLAKYTGDNENGENDENGSLNSTPNTSYNTQINNQEITQNSISEKNNQTTSSPQTSESIDILNSNNDNNSNSKRNDEIITQNSNQNYRENDFANKIDKDNVIVGNLGSENNSDVSSSFNSDLMNKEIDSEFVNKESSNTDAKNQEFDNKYFDKNTLNNTPNQQENNALILNPNLRNTLLEFPFLKTSTSKLANDYKEIVPVMTQVKDNSRFQIGIFSNLAVSQGYIAQAGVGLDYKIRSDWSLMSGFGLEYASYNNGAEVTVQDKLYSFGSTLVDRTMKMNKRTSIVMPIQLKRSFNSLSVYGGLLLNYHLAGNGILDDTEGNEVSVWVTDDVFRPLTLSYQVGASYLMARRVEINVGMMYRTSEISNTVSAQNAGSTIYPSVGFNYLIAKY